jgi:hypothetical protein
LTTRFPGRRIHRMKPSVIAAVILSCVLATTTGLSAQLGKIAKKEAERRKTVTSGKVYTNDSLSPAPEPSSAPATSSASSDAAPASNADKSATDKPAADKPADDKSATDKPAADADKAAPSKQVSSDPAERKKEEEKWRERMKNERDALDRAKSYADALQIKINSLNTDFVNRDDPVQRAGIAKERDKSLAELDRLKKEIADRNKAITAIQEEARRSGAPSGWVR